MTDSASNTALDLVLTDAPFAAVLVYAATCSGGITNAAFPVISTDASADFSGADFIGAAFAGAVKAMGLSESATSGMPLR